ncbi:MAG: peptidoglycan editing factor PgeF [Bacteroidales bacterium]
MPLSYPQTAASFTWLHAGFGDALQSTALRGFRHLFTTRALALRGEQADADWTALEQALLVKPRRLFAPKQVHGADVLVVRGSDLAPPSLNDPRRPHADIVLTNDPESAIAVQVADCAPLLLADPRTGAVAAAHAGWRGTAANVAGRAVDAMATHYGSQPSDLLVAIGPSIGRCCYQVGPDVREAFVAAGHDPDAVARWFAAEPKHGRLKLDLPRANRDQLIAAGVNAANVAACGLCTACHPRLFFSYRRDGAATGRLAGAIRPLSSADGNARA